MPFTRAVFAIASLLAVSAAQGVTSVTFEHPERYVDAGDLDRDARTNMAVIEKKLMALGKRYLAPDDDLRITVTSIDLAGTALTARSLTVPQVRVMNGNADWPRIGVRYTWTSNGRTLGPVDEVIADQNYLGFGPADAGTEPLPYEQRMLEKWFKDRFVARKSARTK